jgi:hypothetical protein
MGLCLKRSRRFWIALTATQLERSSSSWLGGADLTATWSPGRKFTQAKQCCQRVARRCGTGGLVFIILLFWPLEGLSADVIRFHFGESTISLERALIRAQPQPLRLPQETWLAATYYQMQKGQQVYFHLPLGDSLPASSTCRKLNDLSLEYRTLPARGSEGDRNRLDLLRPAPTSYPDISKLETSPNRRAVLDWYQFERDDLRDYRGDKQSFINREATVLMDIQLVPDVLVTAAPSADGCFFRDGVALTRHIRNFLLERLN